MARQHEVCAMLSVYSQRRRQLFSYIEATHSHRTPPPVRMQRSNRAGEI